MEELHILVKMDEKLQEEIKGKYQIVGSNLEGLVHNHGLSIVLEDFKENNKLFIKFSEFQILLKNYDYKITLFNTCKTLIDIITWYKRELSKEFVELFFKIYMTKESIIDIDYLFNITHEVIKNSNKEVAEFVICYFLDSIPNNSVLQEKQEKFDDVIHAIIYNGKVDEFYDFLLKYDNYFEQYINYESGINVTLYDGQILINDGIFGTIVTYNQFKFMKYILLKIKEENRFRVINSNILLFFIIHNKLEIADLIVEEFKNVDEEYNQDICVSLTHEMKKESVDYMMKMITNKILVLDGKLKKMLKQHAVESKNEYLMEKLTL